MKKLLPLLIIAVLLIPSCGKELLSNNSTLSASANILAGNGKAGSANGSDTSAYFNEPSGLAVDASGNVYVADFGNNLIRKITPTGVVTTLAGSGTAGSTNATGIAASFNQPAGVAVDAAGNVYVADSGNSLIRKVTSAGIVTTLAGSGAAQYSDGTGVSASFYQPTGVAVDTSGNVYVADGGNNLIRKITSTGVVTTVAGGSSSGSINGTGTAALFFEPSGIAIDKSGNLFVADLGNYLIRKITPAGIVTTLAGRGVKGSVNGTGAAASFNGAGGLTVDASDNVYVADFGNNVIRKITSAGIVTTLGGTKSSTGILFKGPYAVALDVTGNIYVANYNGDTIDKINN